MTIFSSEPERAIAVPAALGVGFYPYFGGTDYRILDVFDGGGNGDGDWCEIWSEIVWSGIQFPVVGSASVPGHAGLGKAVCEDVGLFEG